jgi:hypothetical protein
VDNTIPQITEGTQILSVAITPWLANSKFLLRFVSGYTDMYPTPAAARVITFALFRVGVPDALNSTSSYQGSGGTGMGFSVETIDVPGSGGTKTYTVRVGANITGTQTDIYVNGYQYVRSRATLTVQEIKQ